VSRGTKLSLELGGAWSDGWTLDEDKPAKIAVILQPCAHTLVFKKEKRRGKIVTLVGSFSLSEEESVKTLSTLKKSLACGGTYKEGWMEFQGDIAVKLREQLEKLGFKTRK
jgi:translation initiation factor 1